MVGIRQEHLGQGAPNENVARPVAAMREPEQEPMEMRPHHPPPQTETVDEQPRWTKLMMAAAASHQQQAPSSVPIAAQPPKSSNWMGTPTDTRTHSDQSNPSPSGRTPLEEYSGQLQLGSSQSESKRFKRAVETRVLPMPVAQYRPVEREQPPPQPVQQQQHEGSPSALFGLDTPGQQGFLRPFNKSDADMLGQAKQMLESSLTTKTPIPGRSPMDTASYLMQRCIPLFVNVEWGQHISFRDDYSRLLVTCQRILTGQPLSDGGGGQTEGK